MLGLLVVLDFLPKPWSAYSTGDAFFYIAIWPSLWGALNVALAAFAGAYVSMVKFAGPAAIFTIVATLILAWIAQSIPIGSEPVGILEIVSRNAVNIAFALAGAILGAELGGWFSRRSG